MRRKVRNRDPNKDQTAASSDGALDAQKDGDTAATVAPLVVRCQPSDVSEVFQMLNSVHSCSLPPPRKRPPARADVHGLRRRFSMAAPPLQPTEKGHP